MTVIKFVPMNFTNELIAWYELNKRELPWRKTNDPYVIWLSEIILQQTRISQGMAYFERFVKKFPTISDLAKADEQEVLKLWQGLGYYSRARNMHHTAKVIVNEFEGRFPDNYEEMIKLKGIGEYTAAAILSIAFNVPRPVVDGNVARLLTRVFGIEKAIDSSTGSKALFEKAGELIDTSDPGKFNQAMMEFGALYCVPANPDCKQCIFKQDCYAYNNDKVAELPVKGKAKALRKRYFYYFLFKSNNKKGKAFFVNKRTGNDIWKHLYDLPLMETIKPVSVKKLEQLFKSNFGFAIELKNAELIAYKHVLTHQLIMARFYDVNLANIDDPEMLEKNLSEDYRLVSKQELFELPVSRIVEKFFHHHFEKK